MIRVVVGPPFAGKSQAVAAVALQGNAIIDTSRLWHALFDPEPGAERTPDQARVVQDAKMRALQRATELELDGFAIVAERDPVRLLAWLAAAGAAKAWLVTAPMATLRERARKRGPSCEALVDKWDGYEDDPDLGAITEAWSEDEMRTMHEFETQYRAALEACAVRDLGQLVQHRCLTERAELRADMDTRTVEGIAVRYDDEAMVYGMRERIARGALELPKAPANLTMQHDRALPLGLLKWQDDDDAMRFSTILTAGARQDQALQDISSGLIRGASLEFIPRETKDEGEASDPVMLVKRASVLRLSLVDDGAYPQSKIQMAMTPPAARPGDHPRASGAHPEIRIDAGPLGAAVREQVPRILMVA